MVADVEELNNLDVSHIHARRLNAKEVLVPKHKEVIVFSCTDGTVMLARRDQVFRTSTLIHYLPEQGEEHNDAL